MFGWPGKESLPLKTSRRSEKFWRKFPEKYKCKGPEVLASESKHRFPDSIWWPWSGDAMTVLDDLDFRKIE